MRRFVLAASGACLLALSATAAHASTSGPRQIQSIGCHLVDGTCYAQVSGAPVGPASCRSNSIRWNATSSIQGQQILDMLTTAYIQSKPVAFEILDTACYQMQPSFPTFTYMIIQ